MTSTKFHIGQNESNDPVPCEKQTRKGKTPEKFPEHSRQGEKHFLQLIWKDLIFTYISKNNVADTIFGVY